MGAANLHSSNTSPWTRKLTELLSDGEWHDYKDVVSLAAPTVPPGPAYRYAEKRRLDEYTKRGTTPGPRKFGDTGSTIRSGQKYYVRNAILKLKKRGVVELEYNPNPALKYKKPQRIRLTPSTFKQYFEGTAKKVKVVPERNEETTPDKGSDDNVDRPVRRRVTVDLPKTPSRASDLFLDIYEQLTSLADEKE